MSVMGEYCQSAGCQVTQIPCKAALAPDTTHHLTPKSAGKGTSVLRCIYCNKTEKEIREKHEAHGG